MIQPNVLKMTRGLADVAPSGKCLLSKDEDLSSDPQHPYKIWMLHTSTPNRSGDRRIPVVGWLVSLA